MYLHCTMIRIALVISLCLPSALAALATCTSANVDASYCIGYMDTVHDIVILSK